MIDQNTFRLEGIAVPPKKMVNGIPCFDDSGYFYSELDRTDTIALASLAAAIGWKKAALGTRSAFVRRYITDQNRSLFLSILPINEGERVLDVGGGWGTLAAQIAKGYPSVNVYAVDKTVERLFFADQIRKQERLTNMHVLQCDVIDPPFENNFFDVVTLIGVLEWVGASVHDKSPRAVQVRALKAIHEMMRPGGRLLVAIENRIGYGLFLGAPDHDGQRFTTLMPRSVADAYMKLRGKGSYRTYTYSRRGYYRLFEDAGFKVVNFYAAVPDYRFPEKICDIDKLKSITHRGLARVFPRQVIGALAPTFYIVAER